MKSRSLSVFLVFLLVFSLVGLAAPARPTSAAVAGTLTIGDKDFTQDTTVSPNVTKAKAHFSGKTLGATNLPTIHNTVGVQVKDADLNLVQSLPNLMSLAQGVDIVGSGTGAVANYALQNAPVADRSGNAVVDTGDVTILRLQDNVSPTTSAFNVNFTTGAVDFDTTVPALINNSQKVNVGPITVDQTSLPLTTNLVRVARLRVTVTLSGGGSLGVAGVTIKGTSVDIAKLMTEASLALATTANDTESVLQNQVGNVVHTADTTKFWLPGTVTFDVDFNAATVDSVRIDEMTTVAAIYEFHKVEDTSAVTVTSTTHSGLGVPARTVRLREAAAGGLPAASSGVYRGTLLLVKDTTDLCFNASAAIDNAVDANNNAVACGDSVVNNKYDGAVVVRDGDTVTVSYTDADPAATIVRTATVDLTGPTIVLRSPTVSATNVGNVLFSVDVTDTASGVLETSFAFNGITGNPTPALGPIANGWNFQAFVQNLTDGKISWWVTVTDKVGNAPKSSNTAWDADTKTGDLGGNNAVKGTSGNRFSVTVDITKPLLASATTGIAGVLDTRVQETGVVAYPDINVTTTDKQPNVGAPFPGQPVRTATFNKLVDDTIVNLIADPNDATAKITDAAKKGTANTSIKVEFTTAVDLDKNTLEASDFSVGGVTPSKVELGKGTGAQVVVYFTMPLPLASDATPLVQIVGSISDVAGNVLSAATLTTTEAAATGDARVDQKTAKDGLVPTLTVTADGVAAGVNVARDKFTVKVVSSDALPLNPTLVAGCLDANNNEKCDGGEVAVAGPASWATIATNTYQGTVNVTPASASSVHLEFEGKDAAVNAGTVKANVEFDTKVNGGVAPTVSPANDATVDSQSPWVTITFDGETGEYTGDTHKKVTLTSATLGGANVLTSFFTADNITYTMATSGLALGKHTLEIGFKDEAGNTSTPGVTGTTKFTFTVEAKKPVQIALQPGWNLISVPGPLDDPSVSSVFAGMTTVQRVYGFDPTVGWQLSTFDAATGQWSGSLAELRDGKGYWVFSTGAAPIKVFTAERQPTTPLPVYDLKAGWNLIGFTTFTPSTDPAAPAMRPVEDFTRSLGAATTARKWTSLVSFNPNPAIGYQSAQSNAVSGGFDQSAGNSVVVQGRGYWIFLTADAVLAP